MQSPPLPVVCLAVLILCGCSSVDSTRSVTSLADIGKDHRLRLLVQTPSGLTDKLIYEQVYAKFTPALPLVEREPYTGVVEVTFTSNTRGYFIGSTSSSTQVDVTSTGWYDGRGYVDALGTLHVSGTTSGTASATAKTSSVSTSSAVIWQDGIMLMIVKDADGRRIWFGDYKYKGGWEMSGFTVNTAEEAGRLLVKRLYDRFRKDFPDAPKK